MDKILEYTTLWANLTTIISWIVWLILWVPIVLYYFWSKKHKALIISSKTFQIPIEKEDLLKAIFPIKIYDETIDFVYDKSLQTPKEFCDVNKNILSEIKGKYNPICIFWIAEMFIPFWIWYYLQDSIHIKWFRKLKENLISFFWNPWAWPSIFSLKWILYIKWLLKILFNRYYTPKIQSLSKWEEVNFIINISSVVDVSKIPDDLKWLKKIHFWIFRPEPSFLINESQIYTFTKKIKSVLCDIENLIWLDWKINIFWTLPVPFCVKLWQSIHRNWPECIIYDFDRELNKYKKVISTKDITI